MLLMLHVYQPCSDGIVETVTRPGIPRDVTDAARLPPVQWRDSEDSIVLSSVC